MTDTLSPTGQIPDSQCPRCGSPLLVVTKTKNCHYTQHPQFVGCTTYPACGHLSLVTTEIKAKMIEKAKAFELEPALF